MEAFLNLKKIERAQLLYEATARYPGIEDPIIMEKDLWVCWALKHLYSIPELRSNITFKGGTSLSKCFDLIHRFSEDCDLTIEKNFIGITDENDPRTAPSRNQRKKRLEKLNSLVEMTVNDTIKPLLFNAFNAALKSNFKTKEWELSLDEEDCQSLLFYYPKSIDDTNNTGYIAPAVKLEFGARADRTPAKNLSIKPYIESAIPEIFNHKNNIKVNALSPTRTFWEKITLLHAEHHRSPDKPIPKRLFRHYYDVMMLNQSNVTQAALRDDELLRHVVKNKKMFFNSAWANYDTSNIGTLKLYPHDHFIPALKKDHHDMADMFFGETPSFERVMNDIKRIEETINVLDPNLR